MVARAAPTHPKPIFRPVADHPDKAEHVAEVLKAVAHPLRIRIVALLCHGETHVNGLAGKLGVPQAIVSQQLRILRLKGLVAVLREDGFAHYRLAEPALRNLVACMDKCEAR